MRRPLGCLTFSALAAAILVTLVVIGVSIATGNAIFSPGALSAVSSGAAAGGVASHAELAGRCDACHAPIWSGERMGDRCLACHTTVRQEIDTNGGFHGRLFASSANCRDCHTDHRGATASLTLADPRTFPHEKTGYALGAHPLRGGGGSFACLDCHPGSPKTFTSPTCVACHEALAPAFMVVHQGTFGTACLNCHDGVESLGKKFDHAVYALAGAHAQASCASCHPGATTLAALRAAPTGCIGCHAAKDVHAGQLGTSCGDCHAPTGWTGASIDHDRTQLPLVGKHVGVACESCHVDRHWSGIGTTCASCHAKDDVHGGGIPGDCAACHAATGWKDVTFDHASTGFALDGAHVGPTCLACHPGNRYIGTPTTCVGCHTSPTTHIGVFGTFCASCHTTTTWKGAVFSHDKSRFPLTGAHQGVACTVCHAGNRFIDTPIACIACHAAKDVHKGAYGTDCASCHSTSSWAGATVNHDLFAFKLTGAHVGVSCTLCHVGGVYKGTPTTCSACHNTPHSSAVSTSCASCHTTSSWAGAAINHSLTAFPLTGAHTSVSCAVCHVNNVYRGTSTTCSACHSTPHSSAVSTSCATCHSTSTWDGATINHNLTAFPLSGAHTTVSCAACHVGGVYRGTPTTCSACHNTPHSSAVSTSCAPCHTTSTWAGATINHNLTAFPLTGAHTGVSCAACHVNGVYRGTPTACSACHSSPSSHPSSFGTTCSACHTTTTWSGGTYTGTHTFPMSHGGANGVCATCHPSVFSATAYTCAACHSNSSMTSRHSGISGFTLTTCAVCHPRGGGN